MQELEADAFRELSLYLLLNDAVEEFEKEAAELIFIALVLFST